MHRASRIAELISHTCGVDIDKHVSLGGADLA